MVSLCNVALLICHLRLVLLSQLLLQSTGHTLTMTQSQSETNTAASMHVQGYLNKS